MVASAVHPLTALCLHVQMLAWSDGDVMDEWTLTKPEGWEPSLQEQEAWMHTFQADPPKDFVDSIGVNQGIVDQVGCRALLLLGSASMRLG